MSKIVTYYCGFNLTSERDRLVYCLETEDKELMSLRGVLYNLNAVNINEIELMAEVIKDCIKFVSMEVGSKNLEINLVVSTEYYRVCKEAAKFVNELHNIIINIIEEKDQYGECSEVFIKTTYGMDSQEYKVFKFSRALKSAKM